MANSTDGSTLADPEKNGYTSSGDPGVGTGETFEKRRKHSVKIDDPFAGDETGEGTKYRSLKWWQASMIMIAETISLGILSLPSVLATVGVVPGVLLILGLGIIATYTGYVIGQFKMAYPGVHNMGDAGEILLAPLGLPRFGREFFGAAQTIFLIFSMASHILTWTIALNTITDQATCTIVWSVVGLIIFFLCDLPRTLKSVSFLSIASFISITSAVFVTMIALGIDPAGRGTAVVVHSSFPTAFLSVTNIIFAFAGHVAFFSFISEFEDPKDFPKALITLQIADISMYLLAAWVIYRYAGADVASPALGSASPVVSKIAYGLAIPTIIVAGVIYGHVSAKYVFVRMFRGTKHLTAKTWYSYFWWAGITGTFWIIAWIIAESIPVFNDLLALISSLFASWFTYGISGIFWLFLNHGQYTKNWKKMALTVLNIMIFGIGAAVCGIGLYASGTAIHEDEGSGHSWSCTPNQ